MLYFFSGEITGLPFSVIWLFLAVVSVILVKILPFTVIQLLKFYRRPLLTKLEMEQSPTSASVNQLIFASHYFLHFSGGKKFA